MIFQFAIVAPLCGLMQAVLVYMGNDSEMSQMLFFVAGAVSMVMALKVGRGLFDRWGEAVFPPDECVDRNSTVSLRVCMTSARVVTFATSRMKPFRTNQPIPTYLPPSSSPTPGTPHTLPRRPEHPGTAPHLLQVPYRQAPVRSVRHQLARCRPHYRDERNARARADLLRDARGAGLNAGRREQEGLRGRAGLRRSLPPLYHVLRESV